MPRFACFALTLLLTAPAFAAPPGFRQEFLLQLADVEDKVVRLAEAIPAEKYQWRPSRDIRSVSEVYMHVAGGNYFLMTFLGVKPPGAMPQNLEKITDKAKVIAELKKSFEHVRGVASGMSNADLEKNVRMFGNETTQRGVLITILNHAHEHLGQSIAYARMSGIVPPWSR